MTTQPRLGILGGMGPQATQLFYQMILDHTQADRDQEHLSTMIFSDTGMPDRTQAILSGNTAPVLERLTRDAQLLEGCGCTVLAVPCNTSHYFLDQVQQRISIPIVHMIRETAAELKARGVRRAGILATDGTVRTGLYQTACAQVGVETVLPGEEEQRLVMSIIYDEIKRGEQGSREKFARIDRYLRKEGCQCGILACTELSVFRTLHHLPHFYLDAMEVLACRALEACGMPLRSV